MSKEKLSQDSLAEASRYRAEYSGHGNAKGASGYKDFVDHPDSEYLSTSGQSAVINPRDAGFGLIRIGAAWDNVAVQKSSGVFDKFLKKGPKPGVDIDLGCLYEMQDGARGCVQAFGKMMGDFESAPYISLSGDERTGDAPGDDEFLCVNGSHWSEIKRLLIYAYIYEGVANWADIKPHIQLSIPGEQRMIVVPNVPKSELAVCAVATIDNVRNGIRLTNQSEYFPGHPEMDRAFGFGIEWADGQKE